MIRMFVRHDVADYDVWRKAYDDFDETRVPMGVKGQAVFRSVENANDVTVWHDFDSTEQAQAFAQSEELRSAMQDAGVQGAPQIWMVEQA